MTTVQTEITKDLANRQLLIARMFDAPMPLVWRAWTEAELLDRWWAPKPYVAVTKSMDFREGGFWHYHMLSPEGEKHWCRLDYLKIVKHNYFTSKDAFCDELGTPNSDIPSMDWKNQFFTEGQKTKVLVRISFNKEEDIETIIAMGFKEGFAAALTNLDELLKTGF